MSKPINPPAAVGSGHRELPAYVSNGLIGLRVRDNPLSAGWALLNGYTGEHPARKIEAAAVAPYPVAGDLAIDGVWLSDAPHQASDLEQNYDFSAGELTTRFAFAAADRIARVEVLTFCSRSSPSLVCQEVSVEVDSACGIGLRASVDAAEADGRALKHSRSTPEEDDAVDGSILWESAGAFSSCGVAYVTELVGGGANAPKRPPLQGRRLTTEYSLRARGARRIKLRTIASLIPNEMHKLPDQQATRIAAKAKSYGFDKLRAQNRAVWDELWKGRVLLEGAGEHWQSLADAAFFYLNSSVHASSPASTSIFGLATWHDYHYYYGHVMWDIEAFAVPPLSLLQPDAAGALLDYRFQHLQGASRNARILGRRGLQFPWGSAPATGEEASPLPGKAAWHEDHVTLVVARAFAFYAAAVGDFEFLVNKAWPVLSGAAEWLTTRVTANQRGFDILESMGIAEREKPADNAAFTNMAAVVVLRAAIQIADRLGKQADPSWGKMANGLTIPRRGKAIVSHDGFRASEEKGATPDPLMGIFPFGFAADPASEEATLNLYLDMADKYIGSPMLSALYGAWAARKGDRQLALKLLHEGYARFCAGRFLQTLEYRTDRFPDQPMAGPFFANIGGFLSGLLFGFAGVNPNAEAVETWTGRPVILPSGWRSIEVDRVWIRGAPMRLVAVHGATTAELIGEGRSR